MSIQCVIFLLFPVNTLFAFSRKNGAISFKTTVLTIWPGIQSEVQGLAPSLLVIQIFNEHLMTKWICKLYKQKGSLWVRLLTAKIYEWYGEFLNFESQHKVKHLFQVGGNGNITQLYKMMYGRHHLLGYDFPGYREYVITKTYRLSVVLIQIGKSDIEEWWALKSMRNGQSCRTYSVMLG
jgi:hypothetical protein